MKKKTKKKNSTMRLVLDPCHCHLFIQKTWSALPLMRIPMPPLTRYLNLFMSLVNDHFWKTNNEALLFHEKHQLAAHVHLVAHKSPCRASFHLLKGGNLKSLQAITFPSFFSHHIYRIYQLPPTFSVVPPQQFHHTNLTLLLITNLQYRYR